MKKLFIITLILLMFTGCTPPDAPEPSPPDDPVPAETGLSLEECMDKICVNDRYDGPEGYFIQVEKPYLFAYSVRNSSIYVGGDIGNFEHVSGNTYKFVIQVPAFGGNEMTPAYDAFEVPVEVTLSDDDPNMITVRADEPNGYFYAQAPVPLAENAVNGLSLDEFIDIYAGSDYFTGPEGYFITFHKNKRGTIGILNSGYEVGGAIEEFQLLGNYTYSYIVRVPDFAGNAMTDPYKGYDIPFTVKLHPEDRTVIDITTDEVTGTFMAPSFSSYYLNYGLTRETERIPFDSHTIGTFYGTKQDNGLAYYLELTGDLGPIEGGIFAYDESQRHIFSKERGYISFYRFYDTLFIESLVNRSLDLYCVEIIDCRSDRIVASFKDVYVEYAFLTGNGAYAFRIGTITDPTRGEVRFDDYIITQTGLHKTSFD